MIVMIIIKFRKANPSLGGTINKWLHIIPRANQGLENLHIVKVSHLEDQFHKHFKRFTGRSRFILEDKVDTIQNRGVDTIQNRGDYIQSNHITKDEDNNSAIGYRRSLD
jgi:hypothetical protein